VIGVIEGDDLTIGDPRQLAYRRAIKTDDKTDSQTFEVAPMAQPSLLLLSRQFNDNWRAQVLTASGWDGARTVSVNGMFQGVMLPIGTQEVRLRFLPAVRFAGVVHAFWLLLAVVVACDVSRRCRGSAAGKQ
jgi:hypothetical protein